MKGTAVLKFHILNFEFQLVVGSKIDKLVRILLFQIDAFKSYENTKDLVVKTNFETKHFFGVKLPPHMARLE